MFNPTQFWWDIAGWAAGAAFHWRHIVKAEATALVERDGPSAAATAWQVAELARARGDKKSALLWGAVGREIARRQAAD
jgi:hypothetical protein